MIICNLGPPQVVEQTINNQNIVFELIRRISFSNIQMKSELMNKQLKHSNINFINVQIADKCIDKDKCIINIA